jgi:hypothetical protein
MRFYLKGGQPFSLSALLSSFLATAALFVLTILSAV